MHDATSGRPPAPRGAAPSPRLYPPVSRLLRGLLSVFFKRIEVVGLDNIPTDRGGLVVSWHPNGLIDPALIIGFFLRPVIFGARHGLFKWPGLGWLMRGIGTVPIFRGSDKQRLSEEERREHNARSLDALAQAVARGGFSCLFPEGASHDQPDLIRLKTGAARFYYRSRQLREASSDQTPVIVPVGLHYDAKRRFRSRVLITIHPPLVLPPWLDITPPDDEPLDASRHRCHLLTEEIHGALNDVVHATESWELHFLLHRARELLRAERAHRAGVELPAPTMIEREIGYARIWTGTHLWRASHPQELAALMERLRDYDADMQALGMQDHELDHPPRRARLRQATLMAGQMLAVYLLLPALLVLGGVVNLLPFLFIRVVSRQAAKKHKDEATIKLLMGVLLYPLTWSVAAVLAWRTSLSLHAVYASVPSNPILAALVVPALAIAGGMVAIRYLRLLRETVRAARVRLTRARQKVTLARLRVERSELTDMLEALKAGIDLPGSVTAQGEVLATEQVPPGGLQ